MLGEATQGKGGKGRRCARTMAEGLCVNDPVKKMEQHKFSPSISNPTKKPERHVPAFLMQLFHGNNVIVHRLSAVHQHNLDLVAELCRKQRLYVVTSAP